MSTAPNVRLARPVPHTSTRARSSLMGNTAHFFVQDPTVPPSEASQCDWCGLPEVNKTHNVRTFRVNPRTGREEYLD